MNPTWGLDRDLTLWSWVYRVLCFWGVQTLTLYAKIILFTFESCPSRNSRANGSNLDSDKSFKASYAHTDGPNLSMSGQTQIAHFLFVFRHGFFRLSRESFYDKLIDQISHALDIRNSCQGLHFGVFLPQLWGGYYWTAFWRACWNARSLNTHCLFGMT